MCILFICMHVCIIYIHTHTNKHIIITSYIHFSPHIPLVSSVKSCMFLIFTLKVPQSPMYKIPLSIPCLFDTIYCSTIVFLEVAWKILKNLNVNTTALVYTDRSSKQLWTSGMVFLQHDLYWHETERLVFPLFITVDKWQYDATTDYICFASILSLWRAATLSNTPRSGSHIQDT